MKRRPGPNQEGFDPRTTFYSPHGAELTAAEVEFARAMERYQRTHNRLSPTCREVLLVAKSLGYCKVDDPRSA